MNVLKPYAFRDEDSESAKKLAPDDDRSIFRHDEGVILFKMKEHQRMRGKSQVFPAYLSDHFRTRATHTDQVKYLAGTICESMGLNYKLAEVIAMGHDLGHTPFGHKGEKILDKIMRNKGYEGFDHNIQSYEICKRWGLSEEVLEGLQKHSSPYDPLTNRYKDDGKKPLLESQVVDLADEMAYTAIDLEDGLRAGILKLDDVKELKLWQRASEMVIEPKDEVNYIQDCVSAIIKILSKVLIVESENAIDENSIQSVGDVRNAEEKLIRHGREVIEELKEAQSFLMDNFYHSPEVVGYLKIADLIMKPLFELYLKNPQKMESRNTQERVEAGEDLVIIVKDFVVGMTDEFAIKQSLDHNIITQQKVDEMSQM